MTADILKRLREKQRLHACEDVHDEPLWGEAADEIERLWVISAALHDRILNALEDLHYDAKHWVSQ